MVSVTSRDVIQISQPVFGEDERSELEQVLASGWVTQGPKVREFEEGFAAHHDAKHAIAVTSCTAGLHMALVAAGIGPGDEVLVPAFTWITTANVVLYCGAVPVLVDVDPRTYNLNIEDVKKRLTPATKAIIPVHLFGLCVDMDRLAAAVPEGLWIIEDAACAVGARYKGRSAGTLGHMGVFSLHPRKSITTGEGGMITTSDDVLAEHLRLLRNHGASISEEDRHRGPKPYSLPDFKLLGYNYRMTDLQGALGNAQLRRLRQFIMRRAEMANRYQVALADLPWLKLPVLEAEYEHAWQAHVCAVDPDAAPVTRNRLMEVLQDDWKISTRPGTHAVHLLQSYRELFNFAPDDFPGARFCHEHTVALPLHNRMIDDDVERIIDALHSF